MAMRKVKRSLRAELGAHPDDVIGHLDRSIPPAPPSEPPGKLSAKAEALKTWILFADGRVDVQVDDLDAFLEIGAERAEYWGSTHAYFFLDELDGNAVNASCYAQAEGPDIDRAELERRRTAPAEVEIEEAA